MISVSKFVFVFHILQTLMITLIHMLPESGNENLVLRAWKLFLVYPRPPADLWPSDYYFFQIFTELFKIKNGHFFFVKCRKYFLMNFWVLHLTSRWQIGIRSVDSMVWAWLIMFPANWMIIFLLKLLIMYLVNR